MFDGIFGYSRHSDLERRIKRIERKIDLLLANAGIVYEGSAGNLPDDVKARADLGDKIGAIKLYRDATGEGLMEAKVAIEDYLKQSQKK